ncbi:MAG: TIGR01777 family protein [Chloroflexi bacterium]|nr:TIGR01777 family protein [Chloroflexota bacterium]
MRIVVTGGTGFLGVPLVRRLVEDGHAVTLLTRREPAATSATFGAEMAGRIDAVRWTAAPGGPSTLRAIDGADAVINLAGEPITDGRWTAARKERIRASRVLATRAVVEGIERASQRPAVLIQGSAVGYYGDRGDQVVTEETPAGHDFLAEVVAQWEAASLPAERAGVRVVRVRTAPALAADGGALARMLPPFRFGLGGPLGSGRQWFPWIHRGDWIGLVRFALARADLAGPLNASAPNPVTMSEFAHALGRALRRPVLFRVPVFALRVVLGELADFLTVSQRVVPAAALRAGFVFPFPELDPALRDLLAPGEPATG